MTKRNCRPGPTSSPTLNAFSITRRLPLQVINDVVVYAWPMRVDNASESHRRRVLDVSGRSPLKNSVK